MPKIFSWNIQAVEELALNAWVPLQQILYDG